jgi:hypothetical protein
MRSAQIHIPHATDTVALGNADGFATVHAVRPAIDTQSVAVNREALGGCCRSCWQGRFADAQNSESNN